MKRSISFGSRLRAAVRGVVLIGCASMLNGCLVDLKKGADSIASATSASGASVNPAGRTPAAAPSAMPSAAPVVAAADAFRVSAPAMQQLNLGGTRAVQLTLTPSATFRGQAMLSLDPTALKAVDPNGTVKGVFAPSTVDFSSGQPQTVVLTLTADTMAPSLSGALSVVATETNHNDPFVAKAVVAVQVMPIYEIYVMGGAVPESWSSPKTVNFVNHPEGVTIRYINMDTKVVHRVHSGGAVPHEPNSLNAATSMAPGGVYEDKVTVQTATSSGYYCHNHESAANVRVLNFNVTPVPTASASPAPVKTSGNPNATYTYLAKNVFQPRCVGCHDSVKLTGRVDLSSYAATFKTLTPGNPSASPLYTEVAQPGGTMPLGGTPLVAADQKAISDWIMDGAKNN